MHLLRLSETVVPFAFVALTACSGVATGTSGGTSGTGPAGPTDTSGTSGTPGTTSGVAINDLPPAKKRAFVTSQAYDGALTSAVPTAANGLEAADALCQLAADAALLGGKFKAYLGSGSTTPDARIAEVGPWFLVDKNGSTQKVFNNKANMSTQPLVAFSNDERGEPIDPSEGWAWVGTNGLDCQGWTRMGAEFEGTVGSTTATTSQWRDTGPGGTRCHRKIHLYCFEQ